MIERGDLESDPGMSCILLLSHFSATHDPCLYNVLRVICPRPLEFSRLRLAYKEGPSR